MAIIALAIIDFQLADPLCRTGVVGVAIWYALAILYFAAYGRRETQALVKVGPLFERTGPSFITRPSRCPAC
jgi:hypothetical protein